MLHDLQIIKNASNRGLLPVKFSIPCLVSMVLALFCSIAFTLPAHGRGGDVKWQMRDAIRGKQEPTASTVDSGGNMIVTGYTNYRNTQNTDEDYWTAKFKADGSGFQWVKSYDRLQGSDRAVAVVVDANNDVIVTGHAWNGTTEDIHTIKYSGTDGSVIWQNTYDANGIDIASSIALDKVNNVVYVGGYSQNLAGNDDFIILKYNNAAAGPGNTPQVVTYNGPDNGNDRLMSVAAGINGIGVTGQSWNSALGQFDCVTIKYDFTGNKLREWRYAAGRGMVGNYVRLDTQGNLIIAATVNGELDYDIYTAKYTASTGATTWQNTYNGAFDDVPTGLYVDTEGNVYLTGYTWTVEGSNDILTMKYYGTTVNPNGELLWAKVFNSAYENTDIATATGIVVDEALYGDVYVTGYTASEGNYDYQTIKYKKENGNILWNKSFNGTANKNDRTIGIALTPNHGLSVVGWSDNTKPLVEGVDGSAMTPLDGGEATATGGTTTTVVNTTKTWVTNQWGGYLVKITSGPNNGVSRYIISNTATGLTVASPFENAVGAGDTYIIAGVKGSISDIGKSWTDNQWAGYYVKVTSGANSGSVRRITANTSFSLTVDADFGSVIAAGDSYYIYDKEDYDTYIINYDRGQINPPTSLAAETTAKDIDDKYTVKLSWIDNSSNEEGFKVERRLGESGPWELIATPAPGTTQHYDTDLLGNNYYYYRVWSFNAATINDPEYSNVAHTLTVIVDFVSPSWLHTYNSDYNLEDYATAIAIGPDDHPVVTGKSDASEFLGTFDYVTTKLNRADTPSILWSSRYNSMQNEVDIPTCVTVDSSNNAYVSGYSSLYYPPVEENINSVFTMKYPAAGPPAIWGGQYNGPGGIDDRSTAVTATTDGSNIVVVGYGKNANNNEDIYLIKYAGTPPQDQYGNALPAWAATPYNGGGDDFPTAVAIAPDGNIFVAGYRRNGASNDVFIAKYDGSTGEIIWNDTYDGGSNGDDRGLSLAIDAAGDAYIGGFITNGQGNRDFLTMKYAGEGLFPLRVWVHTFGGTDNGDDTAAAVRVDPVDGNVVVAGTARTSAGNNDFHIIRYSAGGTQIWERTLLKPATDDVVMAMEIDNSGNIYIAGNASNGVTADSATVKYNYEGTIVDSVRYNGTADGFDESTAVAVNSRGEAFIAGYTINADGNADYLVYRMSADLLPAPYPFSLAPLYTTVALTWADKSSIEDGFTIKRREGICIADDADSSWILVASPAANATTFTDSGLTPGVRYCYRINSRKGTIPSRMVKREVITLMPPAPGAFTATPISTTRIDLSWTDTTTGESQFRIERCANSPCSDFAQLGTVDANATAYQDTTVCKGTAYSYRITAVGPDWTSAPATTSAVTPEVTAPVSLSVSRVSEAEIRLQWTDTTSDETGFKIERCKDPGCTEFAQIDTVGANVTAYNDRVGLDAAGTYRYQVKAYKTAVCTWNSPASTIAESVTTLPGPTGLNATTPNTTQVNLTWADTTASETGFALERCTGPTCDFSTLDAGFPTTVNYNVTAWTDLSVCNSQTYNYRVKAVDRGLALDGGGSWTKRAPLTIANFQADFQTRVVVQYATGMQADFDDIRFFDTRANMELPYWLESKTDGVSATFWIKTKSTNTVYLYYGNPAAASAGNGAYVFEFYDDFSGTSINSSKWTVVNGSSYYSLVNNEFVSSGGSGSWNSGIYSVSNFNRPFVFEVSHYMTGGSELMLGAKDTGTGMNYPDFVYTTYLSNSNLYVYEDGNNRGYANRTIALSTWKTFKLEVLQTAGAKYSYGASTGTYDKYYDSTYSSEAPLKIGFTNVNRPFKWDNARVRKYAATEPTVTVGAEEVSPAFTGLWASDYSNVKLVTLPTPPVPTALTAQRVTEAEIRLQWSDSNADETGFHIDRCTGADCDFSTKVQFTTAPNITQYNDTDVTFGTTYKYRVMAFKNSPCPWETAASSSASAETTLLAPGASAVSSIGNLCNDLRFMDDNAVSINYWIESGCNTPATNIWLNIPSVPRGTKQIYLYTGNPPAAGVGNGNGVFDLFDDFSGAAIDAGKWVETDTAANYITQNNGLNVTGGTGSWGGVALHSVFNFTRPFVFEMSHYRTGGSNMMLGIKDTSINTSYTYFPYASYAVYDGGGNRLLVYESGTSRGDNLRGILSDAWQYYRVDALPNNGAKYYQGNSLTSMTSFYEGTFNSDASLKVGFTNLNEIFKVNMARVRRYASPEPTTTLNPEQYGSYLLAEGNWYTYRPITVRNDGPADLYDHQVRLSIDTTSSAADKITASWNDTFGTETGYLIQRCTGTGCDFTTPAPAEFTAGANVTSYTDWAVANAATYCYRVRAVRAGVWEAPWSSPVCATTSTAAPPANLVAAGSETKVDLTWTDMTTGENGFRVERCTGATCDFTSLDPGYPAYLGPNVTAYSDTNVCGNTYRYRIQVFKVGPGGWSSPLYSDIATATTVLPAAPSGLDAVRASETQANLTWTDTTGDETGFKIERCEGAACTGTDFTQIGMVGAGVTTFTSMGLKPDTTYRFRVKSYKEAACGWESPYSNVDDVITTIQVPVITSATAPNSTQVNLVWTDNTVAETAFSLERCSGTSCDFTILDPGFPLPIAVNTTSYSDLTVCKASPYQYRLKALNTGVSFDGGGLWTRRAPFTVTDFRANFLTRVTINYDADMKADFSDIRFYDEGAYNEIPYWIETKTDGVSATVWVKTSQTANMFLYYGNPSATSASDMNKVFGSGIMGYWPFNEPNGTVAGPSADLSGLGNHATLTNFLSPKGIISGGRYGNALSLDGSNDFAKSDIVNLPTGSVATIEAWINPKAYADAGYNGIVSFGNRSSRDALLLSIQNSGRPSMATWGNDFVPTSGPFATSNAWNHIAVTLNGQAVTLYMNGQPVTGTLPYLPTIQSKNLSIGSTDYAPGRLFNGFIDEVRVYNRALTATDIASRYAAVLPNMTVGAEEQSAGYVFAAAYDNKYSTPSLVTTPTPPAPTSLAATRQSEVMIRLTWSQTNADETGFKIERCEGATCDQFVQVDTVGPNVTSYYDNNKNANLKPNVTYRYRVRAYKTASCPWDSAYSGIVSAVTSVTAPSSLSATTINTTQVNLAWTDNTVSETGFAVERCSGSTCDFSTRNTFLIGPNVKNWSDTTVCNSITYKYRVMAVKRGLSIDGGGFWTRRVPLSISGFLSDFPVKVIIPWDADMKADFADIRFFDATANAELPYWVESKTDGVSATVWVKTGINNNMYLYYGNAQAANAGNGATVFQFFDDFDGSAIDTTKWTITDGTGFSVSGGYLHGTNVTGRLRSIPTYSSGVIQEVKAKATSIADNGQMMAGFFYSTNNSVGFLNHPGSAYFRNDGNWTSNGVQVPAHNMLYTVAVKDPATVNLKIYDLDVPTPFWNIGDIANSVSSETITLGRRYDSDGYNGQSYAADWDWVRVRAYAATEPVISLGAEEQSAQYTFDPLFLWESTYSNVPVATTLTPGVPGAFTATAVTDAQINLTWLDNTMDEDGFKLEQCSNGVCSTDADFTQIIQTAPNATAYSVTGLDPSYTYCFRARSTKAASCGWNTAYTPKSCDLTFSQHPISLTAAPLSPFKVLLNWTDTSIDEDGFVVEAKVWNSEWVHAAVVGSNITTYTVKFGIEPKKAYTYRIRAIRGGDLSPPSNEATVVTPPYTAIDNTCQ